MERSTKLFKPARGVTFEPVAIGTLSAEWVIPANAIPNCAILFLHGGAYTAGSMETHRSLVSFIAKHSGVRALHLNYRLAPEHPYPAAVDDAVTAFGWLQTTLNISADNVAFAGDSAGGGLALAAALRLRNELRALPACIALLSPWTDLTLEGETIESLRQVDPFFKDTGYLRDSATSYARGSSVDNPEISPLLADLRGLPDMLIHVGSHEALLSDSESFATRAMLAGTLVELKVWPGAWHVWQLFYNFVPEAKASITDIATFIRKKLVR
jgi:acetyl esterase/lipase